MNQRTKLRIGLSIVIVLVTFIVGLFTSYLAGVKVGISGSEDALIGIQKELARSHIQRYDQIQSALLKSECEEALEIVRRAQREQQQIINDPNKM